MSDKRGKITRPQTEKTGLNASQSGNRESIWKALESEGQSRGTRPVQK
jgi:hypothetical protein